MTYAVVLLRAFGVIECGVALIRDVKGVSSSTEAAYRRLWGKPNGARGKAAGAVFVVMGSLVAALELHGLVTGKR